LWWQEDPRDSREWKAPDIAAELTSHDYRNNRDPAMEAVREYRAEPSLAERMRAALKAGPVEDALRSYQEYRRDPRHRYADNEEDLNGLGYELLEARRFDAAIAILELNAREYPRSANVYDSLGEAYMLAGQKEQAVRSYRKLLKLDPGNANARNVLQELGS
jgi:tetratricopeptide (TPR) repeat protein